MPKLIVTSRYLKKGAVKKLQNYVKYIATRDGWNAAVTCLKNARSASWKKLSFSRI